MKKILAVFLALILCLGTLSTLAAAKEFEDVKSSDWFYNDVKTAVELGLVNGKSATTYAPNDKLTYAEAIKLAACMHQLYTTGKIEFASGSPWYMPYVEYCNKNKITTKEYNYSENATRAGYMGIFAKALPGDGLKAINSIAEDSIPDVPSSKEYAEGVYKLYRAGILQGVDAKHNCSPLNNITRAEVASILTRMMNPDKRVKFSLGEEDKKEDNKKVEEEKKEPAEEKKEEPEVEPLKVTKNPIGGALDVGGTIKTNIEVTGGTKPYTYQWEYNDGSGWKNVTSALGKVEGENTVKISIKSTIAASYKVRCVIKDSTGNEIITDETEFTFKAQDKLRIEEEPVNVNTEAGKTATVSVKVAGGTAPYKYEWACDAGTMWYSLTNASGCTGGDTDTLSYTPSAANEMKVRCIITDAKGDSVTSKTVDIVAVAAKEEPKAEEPKTEEPKVEAFELVKAPKSTTTTNVGETAVFEVEVKGGTAPYTYQWYFECDGTWNKIQSKFNTGLEGATDAKMSITSDVPEVLEIKCAILDAKGKKIITPPVKLTIEDKNPLQIATQPVATTVKVGEDAKLCVETKGGSDNISYQWQLDISEKGGWIKMSDNDVWLGTTTPELTVKSNSAAKILVRCVITDNERNVRIETESVRVTFE